MPPPLLEQGRQPVISCGEFLTDRALRMVLRQRHGFVPPHLGALAIAGGVPVLGHVFCLSWRQPAAPCSDQTERLVQLPRVESQLGSMNAADLLLRAKRYRDLAGHVMDEQTRAGLLELARKYEALALEVQTDAPSQAR
jgi:endo-beta-N-acetylglucosaminidase D